MTSATKTRSPATPSYSLKDSVEDVRKLYKQYSHAVFTRAEIATTLGMSSSSSSFDARIFALSEYGLLQKSGDSYKVTERFFTLANEQPTSSAFKRAALDAIQGSDVFRELLSVFKTKLPDRAAVAQRLETQKKFNADRAKSAASALERSLQFAGVIDGNGNIVPVREEPSGELSVGNKSQEEHSERDHHTPSQEKARRTEIPLSDGRLATVSYPHDLTTTEAEKIGRVLSALVG
jgi:hypothetical protein